MNNTINYQYDNISRKIELTWQDGFSTSFDFAWLRHHARCANGMPNDTSVKIDLLPKNISILAIDTCSIENDCLAVQWHDDLLTAHDLENLRQSAYDKSSRKQRKHVPTLWDAKSAVDIPRFEFDCLKSSSDQLELLTTVRDFGIAFISNLPVKENALKQIAKIFGPIHVNNYGDIFNVQSDASMNLGSNTGVYLPPHTDESYRHDAPGISMFHCIQPAIKGGDSILLDGFKIAETLRFNHTDSFKVLSKIPLFFRRYAPPDEDMRSHTRVIVTDIDHDIIGVRWTDRTLPPQDIPENWMEPVYQALVHFHSLANSDEFCYQYKMRSGDLHVFDNHRVLHGRTSFDIENGSRHLQQCSVNRDEFHNRLRLLGAKLGGSDYDLVLSGGAAG